MHPSEEIRFERGEELKGKKICLCVTGSIACIESFYLCRDLIRHGADVHVFMTESSTKFLHPDLFEFASGNKVVTSLSGEVEHLTLCGDSDLVIVSPCTANTISKVAFGIADNPVTTCVVSAMGKGKPIIMVPAMHLSLLEGVKDNMERLKKKGIIFLEPGIEGDRAKIPERETILENVIRVLRENDLEGRKVLIIGGASAERIDDIRVLTNRSSGRFAVELAREAFERGAYVELWHGWMRVRIPPFIPSRKFEGVGDLLGMLKDVKGFDFVIVCAALSNYIPRAMDGKIPSGIKGLTIDMDPAPNILEEIKRAGRSKIVAFKAEEKEDELISRCEEMVKDYHMVVGNLLTSFGEEKTTIWIFRDGRVSRFEGDKRILSRYIIDEMVR